MHCPTFAWIGALLCGSFLMAAEPKPEPKYKNRPIGYWVEELRNENKFDRLSEAANAVEALRDVAAPAIPVLMEMLQDRSPEFQAFAAVVLARLGPQAKDALPHLLKLANDTESWDVARETQTALVYIAPDSPEVLNLLVERLGKDRYEGGERLRDTIRALGRLGPRAAPAIPELAKTFRFREPVLSDHRVIAVALGQIGVDAVPLLIELLQDQKQTRCDLIIIALGSIGKPAAPAACFLHSYLLDPESRYDGFYAADALWAMGERTAVLKFLEARMSEYLETPYRSYQKEAGEEAVDYLGRFALHSEEALEVLRCVSKDENASIHSLAKEKLKEVTRERERLP